MLTNRYKEVLDSRGLSVYFLSRAMGVSESQMYKLYKDRKMVPGAISLSAMCSYFNLPPSAFITFTPHE